MKTDEKIELVILSPVYSAKEIKKDDVIEFYKNLYKILSEKN